MDTDQLDSTILKHTRLVFMETIDEAMQGRGIIDWGSVDLVSKDSPDLGDTMYEFTNSDTNQKHRIFFKRAPVGERGFQYKLFVHVNQMQWTKVADEFNSLA